MGLDSFGSGLIGAVIGAGATLGGVWLTQRREAEQVGRSDRCYQYLADPIRVLIGLRRDEESSLWKQVRAAHVRRCEPNQVGFP